MTTRRGLPDGLRPPRLQPVRPRRRRRRDRAVELPADARDVEGRAGAGVGQHRACSSRPRTPRCRRRSWAGSRSRPASRPACSTSSTATVPTRRASALTEQPRRRPDHLHRRVRHRARSSAASAARTWCPVSLELGGKGANIVFDDADLDNAVHWAVAGDLPQRRPGLPGRQPALRAARASTTSSWTRFVAAAEALRIGDPKDPATQFWPAREPGALHQGQRLPRRHRGATAARCSPAASATGWCVRPTIVVDAPADARVVPRGDLRPGRRRPPRSTPRPRRSRLANDTRYGLNAMVFTENLTRAHRVVRGAARPARSGSTASSSATCARRSAASATPASAARAATFSREFFTEPKAVVMQIDADR